jgi:5-methyltetrahydropteroyltriglutamate--homocysteine methyltransferase
VQEQTPGADFGKAYLTPNTELFYLPYSEFEQKLQALAEAASAQEVKA